MERSFNGFAIISESKFINSFHALLTYATEVKITHNKEIYAELSLEEEIKELYFNFTLDAYNKTLLQQIKEKNAHFLGLFTSSVATGVFLNEYSTFTTVSDYIIFLLKINWITFLPAFIFYNLGVYYLFKENDNLIDINKIVNNKNKLDNKKIIFQITSLGFNIESIKTSLNSVIYWKNIIKKKFNININSSIWIVIEEFYYNKFKKEYETIKKINKEINLIIVPSNYQTKNNTKFKARALNYSCELRKQLGLANKDVWIYFQDEETCVGEDTILGILEFIIDAEDKYFLGNGIILYPLDFENTSIHAQELIRTGNEDIKNLFWQKVKKIPLFGYHGSHFLVRSDIEAEIGWDFGICRAEDWLFHIKVAEKYGKVVSYMKGFAYEKSPYTLMDRLKQRRRWILGNFDIIKRKDISLKFKLPIYYSIFLLYFPIPSLLLATLATLYTNIGMFPFSFLVGFMWFTMLRNYILSYNLHSRYLDKTKIKIYSLLINWIKGAVIEVINPWYALIKRVHSYEVINKDKKQRLKYILKI
ncbi:MAG: glycosyltransferase family 2 protein [Thermoproteota archaeon]|nr:glycosyltransferase family 2 protein [Thermoproteota archaeon]